MRSELKRGDRVRMVKPDNHTVSVHGVDFGDCGEVLVEKGELYEDGKSVTIYAQVRFDKFSTEERYIKGTDGRDYSLGIPIDANEVEVIQESQSWQVRMVGVGEVGFEVVGGDEVSVLRKALKELGWEVIKR